jgi:hypothetical protein
MCSEIENGELKLARPDPTGSSVLCSGERHGTDRFPLGSLEEFVLPCMNQTIQE